MYEVKIFFEKLYLPLKEVLSVKAYIKKNHWHYFTTNSYSIVNYETDIKG